MDLATIRGIDERDRPRGSGFATAGLLCIAAYGFLISERETIPPPDHVPPGGSRNLPSPVVTDSAAPPLRPQRHIPNSIATVHCAMVVAGSRRRVGVRTKVVPYCSSRNGQLLNPKGQALYFFSPESS
jgi:hypothetical protein